MYKPTIKMYCIIYAILMLCNLNISNAQEYDLIVNTEVYWPLQPLDKPDYLETVIDPVFDTKITRITGDVGDAIPNVSGETWRNVARHGYNTRQPWNADESILYLQKQRTLSGSWGMPLFVDGETYEVIKRADNIPSANETRWHPTDPQLMLLVNNNSIQTWNYSTEEVTTLMTFSGYSNVSMGNTGNFSTDATMLAVLANRNSDGKQVAFKLDFGQNIKYNDLDLSNPSFDIDFVTLSALGTYIVVNGNFGGGIDRTRIYDAHNLNQVGSEWSEYGRPSHYDTTVDENGDEVVVGTSKSNPDAGRMIKRRMSDGKVTVLTPGAFSGHASARSLQRPGWVITQTSSSTSWLPYLNEILAVKLDGSRVERICNFRKEFLNYYNEAQPAVSPSGSRVIFASDWKSGNVPIQGYVVDFRDKLITTNEVNANAGPDQNICDGQSTTLSASGGDTYLWSTGETTQNITVTPSSTTTYTVTAFVGSESDTDDVIVNVNEIPIANAGSDQEICDGESTTLTASGGTSYLWSNGATSQSINVSPNTTTTYSVTVTENNCSDTDDTTVTVNPSPTANAGNDVTILDGESTTLTASGGDSYLWSTGETTNSISISPTTSTTYTVIAFINGCEDSDEVIVTVESPVVADAGNDITICENSSTTLTASGGTDYLWSTGATTQSITVSPSSTTTYTVTVSNATSSDSDEVIVNVNPNPTANAGTDVTIPEGDSTTLTASGGDSYLWSTGENTQSILVSPNATTTYTVMATLNGCEDSDDVIVTVETDEVVADAGANVDICEGYEVTLTASGGTDYLWSTGETTQSITVNPSATTNYTVIVSNATSSDTDDVTVTVNPNPEIIVSDDITILQGDEYYTLSASGANTYEWSNGATEPNIAVSPDETTTYMVTGYVNNCYDVNDVTVSVVEQVYVDAGEDTTICLGNDITLTATGSGGEDFLWNTGETTQSITVSPEEDTMYTVMASNSMDSDADEVLVMVNACEEEEIIPEDEEFSFQVYIDSRVSNDALNVKLFGLKNQCDLYLFDIAGKLIHSDSFSGNDGQEVIRTINTSQISDGIYVMKVVERGNIHSKNLIIR